MLTRFAVASLALALTSTLLPACGGANSRLRTIRSATGSGAIEFKVKNMSGVPINSLYLAKTEQVRSAGQDLNDNSPAGEALWGADLLDVALPVGQRVKIEVPSPGTWDARALDRDGRYQHITGLHLGTGGRYVLELNDGGWRVK